MEKRIIERTWIEGKTPKPDDLKEFALQGESLANVFIIDGKTVSGSSVDITGTIGAVYLGSNNMTIPLNGTIEDGKAVVVLDDACYEIPGKFILTIYATNGDETQCIYCGIGIMFRTQSDIVAYPSSTIPDILELIELVNEAIASVPQDYAELSAHFPITGEFVLGDTTLTESELASLKNGVADPTETRSYLGL